MGAFGPPEPTRGVMSEVQLKKAVEVRTTKGSDMQYILRHPITKEDVSFYVSDGRAMITDAHILRCMLDHPLKDQPGEQGGFMLIGNDDTLEKMYTDAVAKLNMQTPLDEANEKIAALTKELEGFRDKKNRAEMK